MQHSGGGPGFYLDKVRYRPGTQNVLPPKTGDQSNETAVFSCGDKFTDRCR